MNYENKLDFVYIGVGRAASGWIYECLKEHPEICLPNKKETSPFDERLYLSLGSCEQNQVKGTFVPGFFSEERNAALLKEHFSDIKLILCLRNPIERAHSHYWLEKSVGRTNDSFEIALKKDSKYINLGKYHTKLKPFFESFPKKNILILLYEDIRVNPEKFIKKIHDFLSVKNIKPKLINEQVNISVRKGMRSMTLNRLVLKLIGIEKFFRKFKLGRFFIELFKKMKFHFLINFINRKNMIGRLDKIKRGEKRPPLNPETKSYLKKIYEPEIKNLEKLISRNLNVWE